MKKSDLEQKILDATKEYELAHPDKSVVGVSVEHFDETLCNPKISRNVHSVQCCITHEE